MCSNMDEPGEQVKWNKSVTEGQKVHDCTHTKYLK